ncbi:hypothetical protein U91I_01502 [alpha proteobacterium U9-1i]|nr:hypothetical protein U91I_01502 [alpha proteobacterium U9-1i]
MLLASAAVAMSVGVAHAETTYSVASGIDFSSGDYGGATDTEVVSLPLVVRVTNGKWAFRASTSYLQIDGPADVADVDAGAGDGTGGAGGSSGTPIRSGTERGIGDTNLSVSRTFRRVGGTDAYFETTARVRLPTGDEDAGLGVGATDYQLAGEVGVNKRGGGGSIELARRFLGDRAGVQREDGWQLSANTWMRTGEHTQLGAFGSWREAAIVGRDDPAQVGVFVTQQLTSNVRVSVNASGGLSDGSPDYATGIRFTWRPSND